MSQDLKEPLLFIGKTPVILYISLNNQKIKTNIGSYS
jgi:hypothetical protein